MNKWYVLILLIFTFSSLTSFSQGEWNNWYFGNKAGVSFNSGVPVALLNNTTNITRGCVSISDSSGNFRFLSDGGRVWDKNFTQMPNGFGLSCGGGNLGQPVLAFPFINDDSTFFIFTIDQIISPFILQTCGLRYSVINMRLNNMLGDINPAMKNISVPGAFLASGSVTATRHQNNKDIWLATRLHSTANQFAVYKIASNGLDPVPVLSNSLGHTDSTATTDYASWLKFSQDGTKFICSYEGFIEFCHFNKITGKITPLFRYSHSPTFGISGSEFSPDGKFLYIMASSNGTPPDNIYQYDASSTDSAQFSQSEVLIGGYLIHTFNSLVLGPDAKIYSNEFMNDSLGVISSPNLHGSSCNLQWGAVPLQGRNCYYFLPQFLQKYKAYIHQNNLCQNNPVHFWGDIWPPPDSLHWDFGDPASGPLNYSIDGSPSHIYQNTGTYTVELFVRHNDNRTDTSWQTITIVDSPHPALGQDRSICTGDSVMLDAGSWMNSTYSWDNLSAGLYNISTSQTYSAKTAGSYRVTVTNTNGCSGIDTVL
ncbi:MAG TPA: PKD domain-containing protein, partial [Bacteroidales bacterium]|nr:PKD domain-containing protein [Bacteroidales bacterium]